MLRNCFEFIQKVFSSLDVLVFRVCFGMNSRPFLKVFQIRKHKEIRYLTVPDFFMRVVGFEKEAVSYFSSTNSYCRQPSPICSA